MSTRSFQQIVADAAARPATLLADVSCDEAKRLGLPHPNGVHKLWLARMTPSQQPVSCDSASAPYPNDHAEVR